jgi:hypothetical protein
VGRGAYHAIRKGKRKCSFLKKRTKKLFLVGLRDPEQIGPRMQSSKSFLLLFFKKEGLTFFCAKMVG